MTFEQYQKLALRTASAATMTGGRTTQIDTMVLGLCGETGELAEHIKKYRYHGHDLNHTYIAKELGDLLWYIAVGANAIGMTIEQVANMNIEKLRLRYPEGFTKERSQNRDG